MSVGILGLSLLFTVAVHAQQTDDKQDKTITINLKIVDDVGNPVPKAKVVADEGVMHAETDGNGELSIQVSPAGIVTVSSTGYETTNIPVDELLKNSTIKLQRAKLFMSSDDDVPLPFITLKKRSLSGNAVVIKGNLLDKYPTSDLRNAFTGLATGLEVIEANGATGISTVKRSKVILNARGRNPIFIIDNLPADITEMQLDPQEIETVTVIKDIVAKAMYGPQAADGIIFISTTRGKANERVLNVNIENGISVVDRFPEWASGAEYAGLNNLARQKNGLAPLYSSAAIAEYANNNSENMYFPSSNYREMMLKNTKSFRRVNVSSKGGSNAIQYFANVGYNGDGDIFKIGPASDFNRINTRANMDIMVNDLIKVQFDFYGGLTFRRSSNYGNTSLKDVYEFDKVISDITSIPPIAFPVYANNDPSLKDPWYAVNYPTYQFNPIADLTQVGKYTEKGRNGATSMTFNYDFKNLIKGLKSITYIGFNAYNQIRIGNVENYAAYNVIPSKTAGGIDTILLSLVHPGLSTTNLSNLDNYFYQRFGLSENLSYERSFGNSDIQTTLTYYLSKVTRSGIREPERQQNIVWSGLYSYNDKYIIQCVLNYAGSFSFSEGKRYTLFPSAGASWVISEENFMSDLKFVNFLKLRAEAGILGYESFLSPFYYRDKWSYGTTSQFGPAPITPYWFGNTTESSPYIAYPSRIGNPDLTWEKRKEFNIGFDALLFNRKLSIEADFYNNLRDGIVSQLANSLPLVIGISAARPWSNFNKIRYYGVEAGIQYSDIIGKVSFSTGLNATVQNSEVLKYDEPDVRYSYQSWIGKPEDALWGQTYLGKFTSDAEALIIPQKFDEILHEGDLKYKDMNDDDVVTPNDSSMIGHSSPRLYYSVNAKLSYKNFDLTIIGTGRAFYDLALTNRYFWNGWGDNNYSAFVRDNIGGAYPTLNYYKVNNNFINSAYWLAKGGYFKIQNVELAYNLPSKSTDVLRAQSIRIFLRGANLITISGIKDVDPESINSGVDSYPLFRTFTGGINLTF